MERLGGLSRLESGGSGRGSEVICRSTQTERDLPMPHTHKNDIECGTTREIAWSRTG